MISSRKKEFTFRLDGRVRMEHRLSMLQVFLRPQRERSVLRRHPWVMSGAIDRVSGEISPGAWCSVYSCDGVQLGHGHYSPESQIQVRMLHFGEAHCQEEQVLQGKMEESFSFRKTVLDFKESNAWRWVNAEGDGLPGLVIDQYSEALVLRFSTAGMLRCRALLAKLAQELSGCISGHARMDWHGMRREGVEGKEAALWGEAPEDHVWIEEGGRRYQVDLVRGQKTGFYLDQRDARNWVQAHAEGRRVLDLFSYTGGFGIAGACGGADSVTFVDRSRPALEIVRKNWEANSLASEVQFVEEDAFEWIRKDRGEYDLLVVDPPPLARKKADTDQACRAYKDVFLHAFQRAAPGALILVFSCSHHVGVDLFRKVVFGAALDAQVTLRVLDLFSAPMDHPVSLYHREGDYLTGLLLQKGE